MNVQQPHINTQTHIDSVNNTYTNVIVINYVMLIIISVYFQRVDKTDN